MHFLNIPLLFDVKSIISMFICTLFTYCRDTKIGMYYILKTYHSKWLLYFSIVVYDIYDKTFVT